MTVSASERLQSIIDSYKPKVVRFRGSIDNNKDYLSLNVVEIKPHEILKIENEPLQDLLLKENLIYEQWDQQDACFLLHTSVESLFREIKCRVVGYYTGNSKRSYATKLKTENFIREISLREEDKYLANFILQVFIDYNSLKFYEKSNHDKQDYFESLDVLRRAYGKRK